MLSFRIHFLRNRRFNIIEIFNFKLRFNIFFLFLVKWCDWAKQEAWSPVSKSTGSFREFAGNIESWLLLSLSSAHSTIRNLTYSLSDLFQRKHEFLSIQKSKEATFQDRKSVKSERAIAPAKAYKVSKANSINHSKPQLRILKSENLILCESGKGSCAYKIYNCPF